MGIITMEPLVEAKTKLLNLWRVQVAGIHIPEQELWATPIILHTGTNPVLQLFRGATVATMVRSSALVTPATGGVLQRLMITPRAGTCSTMAASSTPSPTTRLTGFLSAVSKVTEAKALPLTAPCGSQ